jgi:hypothetical protein
MNNEIQNADVQDLSDIDSIIPDRHALIDALRAERGSLLYGYFPKANYFWQIFLIVTLLLFAAITLLSQSYARALTRIFGTEDAIAVVPFLILIPLGFIIGVVISRSRSLLFQKYAQLIGATYASSGDPYSVQSCVLTFGEPVMRTVLSGKYREHSIRIFYYEMSLQIHNSVQVEKHTVFEVIFSAQVPDTLIMPVRKNTPDLLFLSDRYPQDSVAVTLEGDFNKHFKLYTAPDYQMEIREIFEPDFMALLIDRFSGVAWELSGDRLYIYTRAFENVDDVIACTTISDELIMEVIKRIEKI